MMHVYDEYEGPTMTLELPVLIVHQLTLILYTHMTPSMGLDGALIDELRFQLKEYYEQV